MTGRDQKLKVAIITLGCKVNQFESASFASGFEAQGAELVTGSGAADICVINTCAVTAKAGAQSRQAVRQALRRHPRARVVVTGCYAQIDSGSLVELSDRTICVVGNGQKQLLVDIALTDKHCDLEMYIGDLSSQRPISPLPVRRFANRTRAFLRVQDGCNRFCTYCIVPYSRGRSRSLPPEQVLNQVAIFADEGYRELVVTGIHVGHYGLDLEPKRQFADLLKLLAENQDSMRYRISSLEPLEITDEVLDLLTGAGKFMPHLHIPLQSGDDLILRNMNRPYTRMEFAAIVEKSRSRLPDGAIGVDVLVGFPGEDERAFQQTLTLLESLPVTYLHVFPYSRRPGTVAAGLPRQVPERIKKERVAILRQLDQKKRAAFYGSQLGKVREALLEGGGSSDGRMKGFTDNYVPVFCNAPDKSENQLLPVRLMKLVEGGVAGVVEDLHAR